MIAPDAVALILLAAGTSSRFGPSDKLAEPLEGLALGFHAAKSLATIPFAAKIAVTGGEGLDYTPYGFSCLVNSDPRGGQSASLRLGLERARHFAPKAVMIALADMPFVTPRHIAALMAAFGEENPRVGSTDGRRASPPALFGAALFDVLAALEGDRGARAFLHDAVLIEASPEELRDIDTPADLHGLAG